MKAPIHTTPTVWYLTIAANQQKEAKGLQPGKQELNYHRWGNFIHKTHQKTQKLFFFKISHIMGYELKILNIYNSPIHQR